MLTIKQSEIEIMSQKLDLKQLVNTYYISQIQQKIFMHGNQPYMLSYRRNHSTKHSSCLPPIDTSQKQTSQKITAKKPAQISLKKIKPLKMKKLQQYKEQNDSYYEDRNYEQSFGKSSPVSKIMMSPINKNIIYDQQNSFQQFSIYQQKTDKISGCVYNTSSKKTQKYKSNNIKRKINNNPQQCDEYQLPKTNQQQFMPMITLNFRQSNQNNSKIQTDQIYFNQIKSNTKSTSTTAAQSSRNFKKQKKLVKDKSIGKCICQFWEFMMKSD